MSCSTSCPYVANHTCNQVYHALYSTLGSMLLQGRIDLVAPDGHDVIQLFEANWRCFRQPPLRHEQRDFSLRAVEKPLFLGVVWRILLELKEKPAAA